MSYTNKNCAHFSHSAQIQNYTSCVECLTLIVLQFSLEYMPQHVSDYK